MKIKLKNWPFEKGKKVQLIWIGEPFKFNNKWMIDTYFNDGKVTKRINQDWACIHYLSIDKYYTDGDLNSGEVIDKYGVMETIDIDLSNVIPKYNENDWRIKGSSYKSKSRTFNFYKNNKLYTIPIVEIVRSVLGPNTFSLNRILYSDTFEDFFTYEVNNKVLSLYFNSNYRTTDLKDVYYNHFAWIIGNKDILNMISQLGYNAAIKHKMMFDFKVPNFKFTARVRKTKYGYLVQEIVKVKDKRINFSKIRVFHPSFERYERSNEAKKWSYVNLSKSGDNEKTIDNEADGSTKGAESIKDELVVQEYLSMPKIKKEKTGYVNRHDKEDENTKKFIKEDDNRRTFADEGGFDKCKSIEVSCVEVEKICEELKGFMKVLNLLKNMSGVINVEVKVINLPMGKKFSFLDDEIARRQCLISEVLTLRGKVYMILEVERERRFISTIILKNNYHSQHKDKVCNIILNGIVNEGGIWSNEIFKMLDERGISVLRCKHIKGSSKKKAKYIYSKMI